MPVSEEELESIESALVEGIHNLDDVLHMVVTEETAEVPGHIEEVRAAIDAAFRRRLTEIATWTGPTDCDRLTQAFAELERAGYLVLENAGLDHRESGQRLAWLSLTRADIPGTKKERGRCYFTHNDRWRAMHGEGLGLGYGSDDESLEVPPAAVVVCPKCGGKGWITPKSAADFPTPCTCGGRAAAAAAAQATAKTPTQVVGAEIVEACRRAGLEPAWDGDDDSLIELPGFRWQRRFTLSSEADVRAFLESWDLELRAGLFPFGAPLEGILAVLESRAGEWFERFVDYGPELLAPLRAHTERFVAAEKSREATWHEATTCDRIAGAFEELGRRGLLALEGDGLTIQDAWAYAGTNATPEHGGVVLYHHEDVVDAISGGPLHVAFGAVPTAADEPRATAEIASALVAALRAHGVACSWSGSLDDRVVVAPFAWQRRRWTKAPSYPRAEVAADPRAGIASTAAERRRDEAPEAAVVVVALRDEGGFDLRRSHAMRAAWAALGERDAAQVGHLGPSHAFTPPGLYTTMMPRRAIANLREARRAIFERAAGARGAAGDD